MRTNDLLKQYPPESHSWAGKVNFSFSYPIRGWIQFTVTCTTFIQGVIIHASHAYDTFPKMIDWLEDIVAGFLPSEFVIDEEGRRKVFRAEPVNEEEIIFQILEWMGSEKDGSEEQPIYLYVQVDRKQLLSEFLKRWDDFIENQYDPAEWEHGADLRLLDVSRIRSLVRKASPW